MWNRFSSGCKCSVHLAFDRQDGFGEERLENRVFSHFCILADSTRYMGEVASWRPLRTERGNVTFYPFGLGYGEERDDVLDWGMDDAHDGILFLGHILSSL